MTDFQAPPVRKEVLDTDAITSIDNKFAAHWQNWFRRVEQLFNFMGVVQNQTQQQPGLSVTITTAALTPAGAQGSMTFLNGILVAQVQAT